MTVSNALRYALRPPGSLRPGCRLTPPPHGSALITALMFTVIIALALAGISTLTISHYSLAHAQAASSDALDLAEAGVNFELHRITENIADADLAPGTTYTASAAVSNGLAGTFTVYCANQDGSPWNGATAKNITITCTGFVNGARRTIRINAKPSGTFYTTYSLFATQFKDAGAVVNGVSGTNRFMKIPSVTSKPNITQVVLNGPMAQWLPSTPSGYNQVNNSKPDTWDTVDAIMNKKFPGGASYLAVNNDNNLAYLAAASNIRSSIGPGITANRLSATGTDVITLVGKPGGANYYLTDILFAGSSRLHFDNTNGPINIWYNPLASAAGVFLRGCDSEVSVATSPSLRVALYSSAAGTVDITPDAANDPVEMGVYAYDINRFGFAVGGVALEGNQTFRGQIISNGIAINNAAQITGVRGYFDPPLEYFAFSGYWQELDSNGNVGGVNQ